MTRKCPLLSYSALVCLIAAAVSADLDTEPSQQSISEGKQQYEILSQKAQIPNFGKLTGCILVC